MPLTAASRSVSLLGFADFCASVFLVGAMGRKVLEVEAKASLAIAKA